MIEETGPPDLTVLHQYGMDADGARAGLRKELRFSDIREQAWYREPLAAGRTSWTSIYNWVDNPEVVVIGLGKPVRFGPAATQAVVGIDLFLANICDYLAALDLSPGARVFIVERDGTLVANSHGDSRAARRGRSAAVAPGSRGRRPADPARRARCPGGATALPASASRTSPRSAPTDARYFLRVSPWRTAWGWTG